MKTDIKQWQEWLENTKDVLGYPLSKLDKVKSIHYDEGDSSYRTYFFKVDDSNIEKTILFVVTDNGNLLITFDTNQFEFTIPTDIKENEVSKFLSECYLGAVKEYQIMLDNSNTFNKPKDKLPAIINYIRNYPIHVNPFIISDGSQEHNTFKTTITSEYYTKLTYNKDKNNIVVELYKGNTLVHSVSKVLGKQGREQVYSAYEEILEPISF